jgi:hypothetical protein
MSKDKKEKRKSGNSKTTKSNNSIWTIDFYNTSDVGYPDDEYLIFNNEKD